jgi:4-hydroxy-tetrahydrodipicolinate synthase
MTDRKSLAGVLPILVTPFDDDGRLDEESLRNLAEFFIARGCHGLTVLGIAGEVHKLSDAERQRVIEVVVDQARGRVPVVAGTGHSGFEVAVELSRAAEAAGADALLVMPPYVIRPDADGIYEYYQAVAQAVSIPIVVQDEPLTTGVNMPAALIARLGEIPGVDYAKVEATPTPPKFTAIRKLSDDRLGLFGGLGGLYFYEELCRGARGIMTGFGFPEVLVEIYNRFQTGDRDGAEEVFYRYLPLIKFEAQPGIGLAIRKEILRRRGVIRSARLRRPAQLPDPETFRELDRLLGRIGLNN